MTFSSLLLPISGCKPDGNDGTTQDFSFNIVPDNAKSHGLPLSSHSRVEGRSPRGSSHSRDRWQTAPLPTMPMSPVRRAFHDEEQDRGNNCSSVSSSSSRWDSCPKAAASPKSTGGAPRPSRQNERPHLPTRSTSLEGCDRSSCTGSVSEDNKSVCSCPAFSPLSDLASIRRSSKKRIGSTRRRTKTLPTLSVPTAASEIQDGLKTIESALSAAGEHQNALKTIEAALHEMALSA